MAPLLPFITDMLPAPEAEGGSASPAARKSPRGKAGDAKAGAGAAAGQLPQLVLLLDPELCRWAGVLATSA